MSEPFYSKLEKPELVRPQTIRFFRDILCAATKEERSFIRCFILHSQEMQQVYILQQKTSSKLI